MKIASNLASAVIFVLLIFAGCSDPSIPKADKDLYLQVIARIRSGEIKTDGEKGIKPLTGNIRLVESASLPADLQKASIDGNIYIFRSSPGQLFVIFKTWRGKGYNMKGWLYAAVPLESRDMINDAYGKSVIELGPMDLAPEKPVDKNWYRVSFNLD